MRRQRGERFSLRERERKVCGFAGRAEGTRVGNRGRRDGREKVRRDPEFQEASELDLEFGL